MGCASYSIAGVSLTAKTLNRFRWAVCQLDVLQRLKGERHVVQKALKNLPKTLDETYNRILLTLSEEDYQFVHYALQLILYHNNFYGGHIHGGIPCTVLIKGVERSIAGNTSIQSDRFYDHETLRELCGCLVNVTQESSTFNDVLAGTYRMGAGPRNQVLTVSFAHYTVQEYLGSNRNSKNSTAYGTSCKEDLEQPLMEMMFAESLQVEPNEPYCNIPQDNPYDVVAALEGYFKTYCVISAVDALYRLSAWISRHDKLSKLAIVLLDPSKAHFHFLELAAWYVDRLESIPLLDGRGQFWNLIWDSEASNTDAAHLLNILLLAWEKPECLSLAKRFLQSKDNKNFLTTRLTFITPEDLFDDVYGFDGSIVEVFAQSAFEASHIFRLLLEHGTGLFDPSVILLLFIGCHQCHPNHNCSSDCMVKRLLELGADPNMNGCWATPLQIAVHCRDFIAISILLEAGADPNPIPKSDVNAWEPLTLMSRFNLLHGASPLYIHRHFDPYENKDMRFWRDRALDLRQDDLEQIEAILLQYGARSYQQT